MNEINKYISENNYKKALNECIRSNNNHLGKLLSIIISKNNFKIADDLIQQFDSNIKGLQTEGDVIVEEYMVDNVENPPLLSEDDDDDNEKIIRVKLLGNWCTPEQLRESCGKMTKGNYTWNNIRLVLDNDPDYFVVINSPPKGVSPEPSKTIIFQMDPYMGEKNSWGEWTSPDPKKFFRVCTHSNDYNEWYLNKTYQELKTMNIVKTEDVISAVLSDKYSDSGDIKRIDFVKFCESKGMSVHVFGSDKWGYMDYKGSLPNHENDKAMFPYKYVFNCENISIKNYYTEKIIDAILSECLCFYSGCYNIREYIDERAYVYLELSNFEDDYQKVKKAIEGNLWEERIDIIRKEKKKILDYLSFCPRLERIINKTEDQEYEEQ